jgi:hypothetical protein
MHHLRSVCSSLGVKVEPNANTAGIILAICRHIPPSRLELCLLGEISPRISAAAVNVLAKAIVENAMIFGGQDRSTEEWDYAYQLAVALHKDTICRFEQAAEELREVAYQAVNLIAEVGGLERLESYLGQCLGLLQQNGELPLSLVALDRFAGAIRLCSQDWYRDTQYGENERRQIARIQDLIAQIRKLIGRKC